MTQLLHTYKKYIYKVLVVILIVLGLCFATWLQTGFRKNAQFLLTELRVDDVASRLGGLDDLERLNIKVIARVTGASRYFLASINHIRAMEDFNNYAWDDIANKYETMVLLSPMNASYWELGSWQIARNAVAYHQRKANQSNQPLPIELLDTYSQKGISFIQRGLEILPDSASLTDELAKMYADKQFGSDYLRAAQLYEAYIEKNEHYPTRFLRSIVYFKAHLPTYRVETYEQARALILDTATDEHQVPVLQTLVYYLQTTQEVQNYLKEQQIEPLSLAIIFNQPNIQESDIQRYYEYLIKKGVKFD